MNRKTTLTAVKLGVISHSALGYAEDPSHHYKKRQTKQRNLSEFRFVFNSIEKLTFKFSSYDWGFLTLIQLSWFAFSFADPTGQTQVTITVMLKLSLKI